jgi:hypothetical protein
MDRISASSKPKIWLSAPPAVAVALWLFLIHLECYEEFRNIPTGLHNKDPEKRQEYSTLAHHDFKQLNPNYIKILRSILTIDA